MIAAMVPLGLAGASEPAPVDGDSSLDELLEYLAMLNDEPDAGRGITTWSKWRSVPAR